MELLEHPDILKTQPNIGQQESYLAHRKEHYRFLLYKRTNQATVKIIYYVDAFAQKVYITDFFPTEMNYRKIEKRT